MVGGMMDTKKCQFCPNPADVEIVTTFRPLSAKGEQFIEKFERLQTDDAPKICLDCFARLGPKIEDALEDALEEESID
jgi:hypothetical protein